MWMQYAYHQSSSHQPDYGTNEDFEILLKEAQKQIRWSPYFPHVKQAWAQRHHPNLLFIFYEDMKKDLPSSIRRVAKFLNKEVTDEQMVKLCEHLDIENFRKNKSVIPPWPSNVNRKGESFVRKGRSGGWREYFDEEMARQAQRWMDENLAGSGLRYPDTGHAL